MHFFGSFSLSYENKKNNNKGINLFLYIQMFPGDCILQWRTTLSDKYILFFSIIMSWFLISIFYFMKFHLFFLSRYQMGIIPIWQKKLRLRDEDTTNECSVQFSSVAQSCPTLCDPMNRSTPGLPVHHQLPEFMETVILGPLPLCFLVSGLAGHLCHGE